MTDNASRKRRADGYEPRFDLDLEYGAQGELIVTNVADAIKTQKVEVKRDGRWHETGNLYVERRCLRANGWQPSGIATTDALLWAFVLGDTEAVIILPTLTVERLARELYDKSPWYRVEERNGSHPTKGVRIPLHELTKFLARRQIEIGRGVA